MATRVSNCGKDENGGIYGGRAGDQTGGEYWVINWYNFGQTIVLRHPNAKVRAMIAQMAKAAAENNHIGYDQYERLTFWQQLQKVGYKPENITVNCEADCSSSTAAIVKGAGYRLGDKKLQNVSVDLYTGNERAILQAAGFTVLTGSKYTSSGDYLLAGDINLNERTHTNIVVTDGAKSSGSSGGNYDLDVDGWIGTASVTKWQRQCGSYVDGFISGQAPENKEHLERFTAIEWNYGGSMLVERVQLRVGATVDGYLGVETVTKLQKWLIARGYSCGAAGADGYFGAYSAKALQRSLNDGKWA